MVEKSAQTKLSEMRLLGFRERACTEREREREREREGEERKT
jgi:hypothetical protein